MNHMQIRNNWSKTTYQVSAKTSPDKNTSNVFSKIDKYYYIVNPGKRLCAAANNLRYLSPQSLWLLSYLKFWRLFVIKQEVVEQNIIKIQF